MRIRKKNWSPFETALRDMAKARQDWRHRDGDVKGDGEERPSPIDWMRRMSDRLGRRSAELKTLADAAAPLYASLDDNQKLVFRVASHELARVYRHSRRGHERHED